MYMTAFIVICYLLFYGSNVSILLKPSVNYSYSPKRVMLRPGSLGKEEYADLIASLLDD